MNKLYVNKLAFTTIIILFFVLSLSGVAFAGGYVPTTSWSGSPHGGYSAATNKCKVCHAVHEGGDSNETGDNSTYKLLRYRNGQQNVLGACRYCHDASGISDKKVYTETATDANTQSEHRIGATVIPDSTNPPRGITYGYNENLDCLDCHMAAPHGAGAQNNDALTGVENVKQWWSGGPQLITFCGSCHDDNAITDSYNTNTHPHGDNLTTWRNGKRIAWWDPMGCADCHSDHDNSYNTDFPHVSMKNARFLGHPASNGSQINSQQLDNFCLGCHLDRFEPIDWGVGVEW